MRAAVHPHEYDSIYRTLPWAYGDKPDPELIESLAEVPRERALDLGGGQGRHALALAELGFDVTLVDAAPEGLHQAAAAAGDRGLPLHVVNAEASRYRPEGPYRVIVASLFFHLPAPRTSLRIAARMGGALAPGGLLYLTMPRGEPAIRRFAGELLAAAGCEPVWVRRRLVTRRERPRLQPPRRNETLALGRRPGSEDG